VIEIRCVFLIKSVKKQVLQFSKPSLVFVRF
jgi:hypothetical protein